MTEEMVKKSEANARKGGFKNIEFKLGDIEEIPLESGVADCVISNCVINLAQDKQKVFNEAFRILKVGGRLMVSDMVLVGDLPENILKSAEMYSGCIAGALKKEDYIGKMRKAGFKDVVVVKEDPVRISNYIGSDKSISAIAKDMSKDEIENIDKAVSSVKISAYK